jgi:hypothetical protein
MALNGVSLHTAMRNWLDQAHKQAIGQLRLNGLRRVTVPTRTLEEWTLAAQQLENAWRDEMDKGQVPSEAEQRLVLLRNLAERPYSFNTENGKGKAVLSFLLADDVKYILEYGTMPAEHSNHRL